MHDCGPAQPQMEFPILAPSLKSARHMCWLSHKNVWAGWRRGRRQSEPTDWRRQSELTNFSGGRRWAAPIRAHELWRWAARIRAHELAAPIRAHELAAPTAPVRAHEWNSRRRSELTNGIRGWLAGQISWRFVWRVAGGAHPNRKDFGSASGRQVWEVITKWVTNPISKSDHMAPEMCI